MTPMTWALSSVAVASVEGADADVDAETEDAGIGTVEEAGDVLITSESVSVLADEVVTATPMGRASWRKVTSREENIPMVKWCTIPDKLKKRWRAEMRWVILGRWNRAIARSRAWFICARSQLPRRADTFNGSCSWYTERSRYPSWSESLDAQ